MTLPPATGVSEGTAYLCKEYELRITLRCQQEDLDYYGEAPFDDLSKHEIVKALINRRSGGPTDTREVAPLTSGKEIFRLAYGNRHRGATWYDERRQIVWLLAYAQHEFEGQGDAFPYFKELDEQDRLLPAPADFELVIREQDKRFAGSVMADAKRLVEQARAEPGSEIADRLGGSLGVTATVVIVEPLEELYVAIEVANSPDIGREIVPIALAALFSDKDPGDIYDAARLPDRPLRPGELGFRTLLE